MVSLMDHDMLEVANGDDININGRDATTLVSPDVIFDTEPPFKSAATAAVIIFQLLCIVALLVAAGTLPYVTAPDRSPDDAYSILQYCHVCIWAIMIITNQYLHREHNILNCSGYIRFYQKTKKMRKATMFIFSSGCVLLLIAAVVIDNYCPKRDTCSPLSLRPVNYLHIVFALEAVSAVPIIVVYLAMTLNFHRNKFKQDTQHDEVLLSFLHSQSSVADIGFRDGTVLEDIIEKQSDMIKYLKKYNAFLGKKILNLSIELSRLRQPPPSQD
ncbi:transmembrane protein 192-like isoform X1 [Ornithodoros turicata]|uniref:transmembrane protein 192-like isoform X1 n=1 Tax=Ornithodoros turicata TaxID=34597 RepID=UPI00313871CA